MRKLIALILSSLGLVSAQAAEFLPNSDGNMKTINALREAGSDLNKPHPLEHHFYCFSETCINSLMKKGTAQGYTAANIGTNVYEGTKYWYGDLIKDTPLELDIINQENVVMLKLANEFDADYDGWGTPVIK